MTTTLYEIADMRSVLDAWLTETDGELTPELDALLSELDGQADEKIERVALYIREQLAQAKAIKEEEERLAARRKARERAADSLKQYLTVQMERLGKDKVQGLLCTVAFQKNAPSVKGEPEDTEAARALWPDVFRVIPETVQIDRRAILDLAKQGAPLPPGVEVTQSVSLRIR